MPVPPFRALPAAARVFLTLAGAAGLLATILIVALDPPSFTLATALFIALAIVGGLVKLALPRAGSLSLAYSFVLATHLSCGFSAACLAAVLSGLASGLVSRTEGRPPFYRTWFNTGLLALAALAAGAAYHVSGGSIGSLTMPQDLLSVAVYAAVFAVVNTGLISCILHLSREDHGRTSFRANFGWTLPGYAAGASLALMLSLLGTRDHPVLVILGAPFLYLMHASYRARARQLEEERRHSLQTASLYGSITEALALAVEAKDEKTEHHLQRVLHYSLGIGELLGLAPQEMEALRAGALLHDIGKIAVPEYILTKPGTLTPDEMEKMRMHPAVGAQILSAVPFPYPLAPIVRHHHERWDGTGYPDGLVGERIPLGARVLSVVDCYDALTTDRPYRRALSRGETIDYLRKEAGRMFDPAIVHLLANHVDALEQRCRHAAPLSVPRVTARPALSAQLESAGEPSRGPLDDLAGDLSVELSDRLPHRTLVLWLYAEDRGHLVARGAAGPGAERLIGLTVVVGERMAGWSALHQRPYRGKAHTNPLERDGSRLDFEERAAEPALHELGSALVVPLATEREQVGALGLYHQHGFDYTDEHVQRLIAELPRLAWTVAAERLPSTAPPESVAPALASR